MPQCNHVGCYKIEPLNFCCYGIIISLWFICIVKTTHNMVLLVSVTNIMLLSSVLICLEPAVKNHWRDVQVATASLLQV